MSDVPDEILREILSRLPVAPLLRFRCVSKSWKGLIDNQQFIKYHLIHAQKTDPNLNLILGDGQHLYSCDIDLLNQTNMATLKELSHPLETTYGGMEILGSCDGLLVLRIHKDDVTILLNPWVRRFHQIPFCGIVSDDTEPSFGFGFDVVSDDYKLIRIVRLDEDEDEGKSEVKVYSLKSDSWRRIPDFLYDIRTDGTSGVLANGYLHWTVTGTVNSVAAFDLGTEEFRMMALPKFEGVDDDVTVLGGCLSFMCFVNEDHFDLWVMKEYGVQESWSILFTFYISDFEDMRPLSYSKCGRKVLLRLHLEDGDVLMWYDLDTKSTDLPMVQMPSKNISTDEMCTCLQSLVLLNNGTSDFDLVTKKKQERND